MAKKKPEVLSIERALYNITSMYGDVVKKFDVLPPVDPADFFSTGCLSLDIALGGYGIKRGVIVEIFGPESSGKTTLTLEAIASIQREGKKCIFIDAEHALDLNYATNLGVKVDDLYFVQPDYGEMALNIMMQFLENNTSHEIGLIVVDSVAALTPKAELDGDIGDSTIGLQARLMSQTMRKIVGPASKNKVTVLFVNQIREKIGVMFGNPEVTPAGRALKFYSSYRLDVRKTGTVGKGNDSTANETRVKIVKNKVAPPFRESTFQIEFGKGISKIQDLINCGLTYGVLEKSGTWLSYNGERLGQGESKSMDFLKENPDLALQLRQEVLMAIDHTRTSLVDVEEEAPTQYLHED